MGEQNTAGKKRKTKRRSRAQVEADRRLSALRKNLAVEIEADISRFSGEGQSPVAGLLVLTRVRILLAFLQAFFPLLIKAPKPRRIPKKRVSRSRKKKGRATPRKKAMTSRTRRGKVETTEQSPAAAKFQPPVMDLGAHAKIAGEGSPVGDGDKRKARAARRNAGNEEKTIPAVESIKIVRVGAGSFS